MENPATNEHWDNYFALNILGMARAADLERSKFDTIMQEDKGKGSVPPLLAFKKLVLKKNKIPGLLIFRLAESPSTLIVHEAFVKTLTKEKPVEGWGIMVEELIVV